MTISSFQRGVCNASRRPGGPAIGPRALPDAPAHAGWTTCADASFKLHAVASREDMRHYASTIGLVTTGTAEVLRARLVSADNGMLPAGAFANGLRAQFDAGELEQRTLLYESLRTVASKSKNVKEIMSIFDEFVIGLTKEQFIDILKYVFQNPG
eukprot:SAG11_NODE_1596_length_4611_cov_3.725842_2_plen_155_part_00